MPYQTEQTKMSAFLQRKYFHLTYKELWNLLKHVFQCFQELPFSSVLLPSLIPFKHVVNFVHIMYVCSTMTFHIKFWGFLTGTRLKAKSWLHKMQGWTWSFAWVWMCTPTNKPPNLHKFGNVVCFTLYIFKVVKMPPSYMDIRNVLNRYGHKVWNVVLVFWEEYLLHHTTHLSQHSHHQRQKIKVITLEKTFFSIAPFFYFAKLPNHTNTHPHILSVKKCFVPKKNVNWHIYVIFCCLRKIICSMKLKMIKL